MNLEELCSYIKELFEEQKATQRAIALNQSKLASLEAKIDRFTTEEERNWKDERLPDGERGPIRNGRRRRQE